MTGGHGNSGVCDNRSGGLLWRVRQGASGKGLERLLADPNGWLSTRARLFKGPGRSSTVGAADGLVLKRYNFRKVANLLKDLFRPSRALRAFHHARQLEALDVATPRAIAAAEHRRCRILLTSYLVTEEIPAARELGDYLAGTARPDRELIARVARLIGRLHAAGYSHRDLKESNILLDAALQPWLIDLDGLRFLGSVGDARAAADLLRLERGVLKHRRLTRAERMLFLKSYSRARRRRWLPRM